LLKSDSIKNDTVISKLNSQYSRDSIYNKVTSDNFSIQLDKQRKIINDDSVRFNMTLKKFGDQLSNQKNTLDNIQEVLHPLLPIKITLEFNINLSDMSDTTVLKNQLFYNTVKDIFKHISASSAKEIKIVDEFKGNFSYVYVGEYGDDKSSSDKKLRNFNSSLFINYIPVFNFFFYKNDTVKILSKNSADLVLSTYDDNRTMTACKFKYEFRYNTDTTKYIKATIIYNSMFIAKDNGRLTSILSLKNGLVAIIPRFYNYQKNLSLNKVYFECGTDYAQKFEVSYQQSDLKKYSLEKDKDNAAFPNPNLIYIKKGGEILKSNPYDLPVIDNRWF